MFDFTPSEFDKKNALYAAKLMAGLLGTLIDKKILTEKEALEVIKYGNKALEEFNTEEKKKYEKYVGKDKK